MREITSFPAPLGDLFTGTCRADPSFYPAREVLEQCCNFGYARGRCGRFPDAPGPDATRFAIARDEGGLIRISWVQERDYHPFAHGVLEDSARHDDAVLERQAEAYRSSYLRRK